MNDFLSPLSWIENEVAYNKLKWLVIIKMKRKLCWRKTEIFEEANIGQVSQKGREEEKNNKKIKDKQNSHLRKISPQHLFQVELCSYKVHIFCISRKEFKTYDVDFAFSRGMGFYHVENSFYFG